MSIFYINFGHCTKILNFMLRKNVIGACIIFASGLLFVNVYTSLVDATNWAASLPESAYAARNYFKTANPGNFFRIFSPVHQALVLLLLIVCWRMGAQTRWLCFVALVFAIGADLFTFAYFYPRNTIIFGAQDPAAIERAVHEWATMNWLRSAMIGIALCLYFLIQQKIYKKEILATA